MRERIELEKLRRKKKRLPFSNKWIAGQAVMPKGTVDKFMCGAPSCERFKTENNARRISAALGIEM